MKSVYINFSKETTAKRDGQLSTACSCQDHAQIIANEFIFLSACGTLKYEVCKVLTVRTLTKLSYRSTRKQSSLIH